MAQVPSLPEWWLRLSSTFLSFLSSSHPVDLWLVCRDGFTVPAHQLLFLHTSPSMVVWLAGAREDTQEDSVSLLLPDWDSDTVGQLVTSLYQGRLPQGKEARRRLQLLARELGLGQAREEQVDEADAEPVVGSVDSLVSQPVQVLQTISGEILLATCKSIQEAGKQFSAREP